MAVTCNLLQENGDRLLQENGDRLLIENCVEVADVVSETDGKRRIARSGRRRRYSADDDLTEAEAQYVLRKIRELKQAKTAREEAEAARALEIALAQAAQGDDAAEIITEAIEFKQPGRDYAAALRDVELMQRLGDELMALAIELAAQQQRMRDEDDAEALLLLT
jgi:hypothetical protein